MKNILILTIFTLASTFAFANNGDNPTEPVKAKKVRSVKILTIFKLPTQTQTKKDVVVEKTVAPTKAVKTTTNKK